MNKMTVLVLVAMGALVGCETLLEPTTDGFLEIKESGYVLNKKDENLLDGPYKIVERTTRYTMCVERDSRRYILSLRGCQPFGSDVGVANTVMGSYYEDLGAYLLKDSVVNVSSNEIKAVVYSPANQVYVGGVKGFDNLTYVMPQVMHIAYGELRVDHSDTNFPLYKVFVKAERLAQKKRSGYWATHSATEEATNQ
jgi:hypothetical protein